VIWPRLERFPRPSKAWWFSVCSRRSYLSSARQIRSLPVLGRASLWTIVTGLFPTLARQKKSTPLWAKLCVVAPSFPPRPFRGGHPQFQPPPPVLFRGRSLCQHPPCPDRVRAHRCLDGIGQCPPCYCGNGYEGFESGPLSFSTPLEHLFLSVGKNLPHRPHILPATPPPFPTVPVVSTVCLLSLNHFAGPPQCFCALEQTVRCPLRVSPFSSMRCPFRPLLHAF